jgi:hypothetical protein
MDTFIDHNPDCGTSGNALAMIGRVGVEPPVGLDLLPPQQCQAG